MDWMLLPLRRYADFQGRSRRKEYWMFFLLVIIAVILALIIDNVLGMGQMVAGVYGPVLLLVVLGIFIPSLAVQVRRFHDQDKSG